MIAGRSHPESSPISSRCVSDPLADVAVLERVERVMHGGRAVV